MKPAELTGRYLEVAQMAFEGMTTRHIARELGMSIAAASRLLDEVFTKVGVSNRRELRAEWTQDEWARLAQGSYFLVRQLA